MKRFIVLMIVFLLSIISFSSAINWELYNNDVFFWEWEEVCVYKEYAWSNWWQITFHTSNYQFSQTLWEVPQCLMCPDSCVLMVQSWSPWDVYYSVSTSKGFILSLYSWNTYINDEIITHDWEINIWWNLTYYWNGPDHVIQITSSCPSCPSCPTCPESPSCPSTWEILSWYILESSIDSSYCVWNWYCPVESWSNWSSLFINWIQHESYPMINIDITDNVPWDYSINNDVFDLDVWEAYDQDFIDWVIDSQKTLPNKTDFNNTISWLIPLFIPWLVIILFIYFIFRFIKKIF